ncbi:hypothetical protein K7B10_32685 [Streptomyces flavotricini]|uniref:Lipoprotein n=1 Tax=Streptomyces flavotricini TaxID=66888 RepID=A0ABS8EEF7_9ACTN|nr:hypothetical protein [Streptomyces flavotricini]MCC0099451.1 hypothetical protein [Streptomyces flavotricini]
MTSRTTPARAVLLAAALLLMTACGTTVSGSGAVADPSPVPSRTPDHAAQEAAAVARHDKLFPEVAAACEGRASVTPTGSAAPDDVPTDPAARKYAENHAYRNEAVLTPSARCRGDAHAARIKAALAGSGGKGAPQTAQELGGLLTGMGYKVETGDVSASSTGGPSFVLSIPESGPCVTGQVGPPVSVKAHGPYMEGGCHEPRGGH